MTRKRLFLPIIALVAILALAACGAPLIETPATPTPEATTPPEPTAAPTQVAESIMPEKPLTPEEQKIAEQATAILAKELNVVPEDVTILEVTHVTWRDSSLGCPEQGMMYTQVITPGYRVKAEVNGETYAVHMNEKGVGKICPANRARPPLEPAD